MAVNLRWFQAKGLLSMCPCSPKGLVRWRYFKASFLFVGEGGVLGVVGVVGLVVVKV